MAMNAAPAIDARNPSDVTPPEVPAGTSRRVVIDRGSRRDIAPISVAHVSAFDAAIEPAPRTVQAVDGYTRLATAIAANGPPFAITCQASRAELFSTTSSISALALLPPTCDKRDEATKNARRVTAHIHPAAAAAVATNTAATAPLVESACRDLATAATTMDTASPAIDLVTISEIMAAEFSPARRLQ